MSSDPLTNSALLQHVAKVLAFDTYGRKRVIRHVPMSEAVNEARQHIEKNQSAAEFLGVTDWYQSFATALNESEKSQDRGNNANV